MAAGLTSGPARSCGRPPSWLRPLAPEALALHFPLASGLLPGPRPWPSPERWPPSGPGSRWLHRGARGCTGWGPQYSPAGSQLVLLTCLPHRAAAAQGGQGGSAVLVGRLAPRLSPGSPPAGSPAMHLPATSPSTTPASSSNSTSSAGAGSGAREGTKGRLWHGPSCDLEKRRPAGAGAELAQGAPSPPSSTVRMGQLPAVRAHCGTPAGLTRSERGLDGPHIAGTLLQQGSAGAALEL